ncbi:phosphoserine phosphatase RsbX [Bacillus inaquosorum]|jgi:phosphoserine phosphatase RsbX|uniref:Phosphoserine phosphatase RsbX n=1 Tax=Bacillus spizizenii (strain DSM 15029 / JCM 12233 / NBRC 101239 / NRRL B-23049 / TU-B-10) TaxID=1052585 RepID=G4NW61_BACS4|nr:MULTISPECIES: phosphoserine phosphatase RsbX [Bacillus subtilis group]APH67404.1 phosphoserine phosphatase [Bacillus subtilis]AEP85401.1 phosphoserine phosphatase RsbX [Bacillus spizizenii TU-B-10]KXJ39123.1 phosphoserine phosphatase [Bacillus spizizenii]MBK4205912.1 phosphoserine phosphatase [Bacillus subtilis]MCI4169563.1 phosphoserine phosphatase RsbX [Bacillus spizizenii]
MIQVEENEHIQTLVYQLNKEGKSICGDSFFMKADDKELICAVADGLGSGSLANESSAAIKDLVENYANEDVQSIIERCNQAMKNKRGATASILKINFEQRQFTYCSVGNVRFILHSPSGESFYPLPISGYLSGKPQKYKTHTATYEKGSRFIIHTDGLNVPDIRSHLKKGQSVEEISNSLKMYTTSRKDDLTYILGQLS